MTLETIEHAHAPLHAVHHLPKPSVFVYTAGISDVAEHARAIRVALGLDTVVDTWRPGDPWPTNGALILTDLPPTLDGGTDEAHVMGYADAMSLVGRHIGEQAARHAIAPQVDAGHVLREAARQIDERAALRDCPEGERSMGRCVAAFNALTGHALSETEGWNFMELLKLARATAGRYHADDHTDCAAYAALAAESAAREAADRRRA
jgi:hypothetical protein